VKAWLDGHYLRFDVTPQARLTVTAEDVYQGLVARRGVQEA
jgi:hypothetical protein